MKNTLKYIGILVMGVLAAASCNLNSYPVFDDKDAFVAFDATGYEFNEPKAGTTDTVYVYATLASVAGLSSTASYEVVEDTTIANPAVQGYDFDILDENGVLRFDEANRTCAIPIVLYSPKSGGADGYTGNKSKAEQKRDAAKDRDNAIAAYESKCAVAEHRLSLTLPEKDVYVGKVENLKKEKEEINDRYVPQMLVPVANSRAIDEFASNTYGSLLSVSDWNDLDLIIYYMETNRADYIQAMRDLPQTRQRVNTMWAEWPATKENLADLMEKVDMLARIVHRMYEMDRDMAQISINAQHHRILSANQTTFDQYPMDGGSSNPSSGKPPEGYQ